MSLRQEPKSARRMWPFTSSRMLSGLMSLKEDRRRKTRNLSAVFLLEKQGNKTGKREVICICVVGVGHRECTHVQHKHTLKKRECVLHGQWSEGGHIQHFQMCVCWHCGIPFDLHLFFMTMAAVTFILHMYKVCSLITFRGTLLQTIFCPTARNQQWKLKVVGVALKVQCCSLPWQWVHRRKVVCFWVTCVRINSILVQLHERKRQIF